MAGGSAGRSVLSRVLDVLESFDPNAEMLTVSQIAQRAGLTAPTAHRLVTELLALGLLERGPNRTVHVGLRLWEVASAAPYAQGLRELAMPALEDLQATVRQHTQLYVREGTETLLIERLSSRTAVPNFAKVGGRLPLHASSGGLVLLAHGGPELEAEVLSAPMRRYTPTTPVRPEQVQALLATVRERGYIACDGFISDGAMGVAVPVRDGAGETVAALSVVVPSGGAQPMAYVNALVVTARAIGRELAKPRVPQWHPMQPTSRRGVRPDRSGPATKRA
ncbi:IclR family transcriptional regulator [Pseudonocardia sulfidoxydans NBRC 16205]|uniref:IclR family transcriptional regulator n=1 Tax=Pseudonocardia sulfidoxydans NBRC 16205 TaxID=1223511 RepID=A0A511DQE9_9PSEU|nr:IclR family transcriptional regulator [Pseudonocardia sulfidoxydans]GEL27062.1 IclR family transcriptional regulator [Pseudonocardia sulfidoxydans NBRC 16205]